MFKRLRWMMLGGLVGVVSSMWAQRKARRLADRYAPVRGTVTVAGAARRFGRDVRAAFSEGREEMHDTERRLRQEFAYIGGDVDDGPRGPNL